MSRPKGTFFFPPLMHSADEIISFWESVDIPDEAMLAAQRTYAKYLPAVRQKHPEDEFPDRMLRAEAAGFVRAIGMTNSAGRSVLDKAVLDEVNAHMIEMPAGMQRVDDIRADFPLYGVRDQFMDLDTIDRMSEDRIAARILAGISKSDAAQNAAIDAKLESLGRRLANVIAESTDLITDVVDVSTTDSRGALKKKVKEFEKRWGKG